MREFILCHRNDANDVIMLTFILMTDTILNLTNLRALLHNNTDKMVKIFCQPSVIKHQKEKSKKKKCGGINLMEKKG